jgi:ankyrin repeat protein
MNKKSFWTPIHWAARFGDVETIKLLLSRKPKAFTPDYKCLFPIDLAGYFQHSEALKLLVDYSIDCYKELTLTAT